MQISFVFDTKKRLPDVYRQPLFYLFCLLFYFFGFDIFDIVKAVVQLLEFAFAAIDAVDHPPVAYAGENDTDTDQDGKRLRTDGRAIESVDTKSGSQQTEQKQYPPIAETDLLEIK